MQDLFKYKHFETEIILLSVRWYLKYALSYRNLAEIMAERGLNVAHTTIMRWVHQYSPEIKKRVRKYLKPTNDSWRVDETYLKVKGKWLHLYRAVDSKGNTIDFFLSKNRDKIAARKFFKKALKSSHNQMPRIITVDKNPSYEQAIPELIYSGTFSCGTSYRQTKYLKNIIEQDHRHIKRLVNPMMGFKSFESAGKTIAGIEIMHMIRKGQIQGNRNALFEVEFINQIMGLIA